MIDVLNGKLNNLFFKVDSICKSNCKKSTSKDLVKQLVQKRGDHFTFLKIYNEFKTVTDKKIWADKYGIRINVLNAADKMINNYYYKIVNLSKAPKLSRISNVDIKKRLTEALTISHQHLVAIKMVPTFSKKKIEGQINKDSAVHYFYNKKDLMNKKFIYDELVNVNGKWEFNIVSLI